MQVKGNCGMPVAIPGAFPTAAWPRASEEVPSLLRTLTTSSVHEGGVDMRTVQAHRSGKLQVPQEVLGW